MWPHVTTFRRPLSGPARSVLPNDSGRLRPRATALLSALGVGSSKWSPFDTVKANRIDPKGRTGPSFDGLHLTLDHLGHMMSYDVLCNNMSNDYM